MSNKSPNLVTLRTECLRRIKKRMIPREKFFTEKSQKQKDAFLGPAAWPDVRFIFSFYGYYQQQTIAQKHTKGAKVLSRLCQILKKPSKCCQDSLNFVSLAGDKVHKVTRFLSKRKEVKWKKGEELVSSVTRFGVISPLWENFTSLWQNFHSSFHIRQNTELTLANLWHYWANFHYCKWPNIQK